MQLTHIHLNLDFESKDHDISIKLVDSPFDALEGKGTVAIDARRAVRKMVHAVLCLQHRQNEQSIPGEKALFPADLHPLERCVKADKGVFLPLHTPDGHILIVKVAADNATKLMRRIRSNELASHDVSLAAGTCLFSAHGAYAHNRHGETMRICDNRRDASNLSEPVDRLNISSEPSLYETELSHRSFELIRLLRTNKRLSRTYLHLPRVEYYLFILNAYNHGYFPADLASQWFDAVDQRADATKDLWESNTGGNLDCDTPLGCLSQFIRGRISDREKIPVGDIVKHLRRTTTHFSSTFDQVLSSGEPTTFKDLNHQSYCVEYIHLAKNNPMIAVLPPEEEKILTNVAKIDPSAARNIVPIQIQSQVITNQQTGHYYLPRLQGELKTTVMNAVRDQYRITSDRQSLLQLPTSHEEEQMRRLWE